MTIDQMAAHRARDRIHEIHGPDAEVKDHVDEFLGLVAEAAKDPKKLMELYGPKEEVQNVPSKTD